MQRDVHVRWGCILQTSFYQQQIKRTYRNHQSNLDFLGESSQAFSFNCPIANLRGIFLAFIVKNKSGTGGQWFK